MVMLVKSEQPLNADEPMLVTPAGIEKLVNFVFWNIQPPKVVRPLGRVALARLVQS